MKRTDITAIFPDATDEQIKNIMDLNGGDINKARADLTDLQTRLTAAEAELGDLKSGKTQTDAHRQAAEKAEKLQKELDGMKAAESVRGIREKVAGEKKIPVSLLTAETEEDCAKQADAILAFAQPAGYPDVRDGGEPANGGTAEDGWHNLAAQIK